MRWRSACWRKSLDESTRILKSPHSRSSEGLRRWLRGSLEVQTRQPQPMTGTPVEVPVPRNVTLMGRIPPIAGRSPTRFGPGFGVARRHSIKVPTLQDDAPQEVAGRDGGALGAGDGPADDQEVGAGLDRLARGQSAHLVVRGSALGADAGGHQDEVGSEALAQRGDL